MATGPMVLEPIRGPFGKLGCAIVAALFWNGFISLFVWHVVQEWQVGNPQWGPALILTPFVLIGLLLLSSIPYSVLALVNPRPRLHLSPGSLTAVLYEGGMPGYWGRPISTFTPSTNRATEPPLSRN